MEFAEERRKTGFGSVKFAASNLTNACYAAHLHNGCVLYGRSLGEMQLCSFVNVPMCARGSRAIVSSSRRRCKRVASAVQACHFGGASVSRRQCKHVTSVMQACRVGRAACRVGGAGVSRRRCKSVSSTVRVASAVQACHVGVASVSRRR